MPGYLALGLLVTFDEEEDCGHYGTGKRDRKGILWCRFGDAPSSGQPAPVVAIAPASDSGCRAVIHPVPIGSALWGTIGAGEALDLYREDQQIGTAAVSWVQDTNQGLQPNELRMMVHWTQAGGPSPFNKLSE